MTIDFDSRYSVDGYRGIAFYLVEYAAEVIDGYEDCDDDGMWWYVEPEVVEDRSRVIAVMVGDDRRHTVDIEDLTPLSDEDYCSGCGQIGCGH